MPNLKPLKSSIGQPAEGEDKFFPRDAIVRKIFRKLDGGENLLLSAPRRIGKSSILKHMEENPQENQIIKYIAIQSIDSQEEFFKKLYNELIEDKDLRRVLGENAHKVFKEKFDVKIYRIVNNDDIVPKVPPPGKYVHVGELKFIDSDGIIQKTMIENEGPVDQPCDEPYGSGNSNQPKKNAFEGFVPAPLRDHVAFLYAIHIWNNIIESQQ